MNNKNFINICKIILYLYLTLIYQKKIFKLYKINTYINI